MLGFLPVERLGAVTKIEAIRAGLSGAGVYAVTTSQGEFVLRIQDRQLDEGYFAQQLAVLRQAAAARIAPELVHVDEAARASVSRRIQGKPLGMALADPVTRPVALASAVDQLRTLHAFDAGGIVARDPLAQARTLFEREPQRAGFPSWAIAGKSELDAIGEVLARDTRRVISHNDTNPGNFLWDGARTWLVDWEVCGLGHPYYDLAVFAMFLRLEEADAFALIARHDGSPPDARSQASFRALSKLGALLCGVTFLSLVQDLTLLSPPTRQDAPTLLACYEGMRQGRLSLQSPLGQLSMALALLATGLATPLE